MGQEEEDEIGNAYRFIAEQYRERCGHLEQENQDLKQFLMRVVSVAGKEFDEDELFEWVGVLLNEAHALLTKYPPVERENDEASNR